MSRSEQRTFITMLVWLKPEGQAALSRFRELAQPLFERYELRVERVLAGKGKGQLLDANPWEVPDVIQVVSMPSLERFRAYAADPEYQRLARDRDAGISRMVAVFGTAVETGLNPESASAVDGRLYGAAFVRFKPGGEEGLMEFNRRASGLFARHGMHLERMLESTALVTPVGSPLAGFEPRRTLIFFLDDPAALPAYAADPEYKALAPLRDVGLERYDFFTARAQAAPAAKPPSWAGAGVTGTRK